MSEFGGITKEDCEKYVKSELNNLLSDISILYSKAIASKDWLGIPCLNSIKCADFHITCWTGNEGGYNPLTRNIILCYKNITGSRFDPSGTSALRVTLRHELNHAISVCGWWDCGCKACMIEEMAAFYHAGQCTGFGEQNERNNCAIDAWDSCTSNSFCMLEALLGKTYDDYKDVGPWPPKNPLDR